MSKELPTAGLVVIIVVGVLILVAIVVFICLKVYKKRIYRGNISQRARQMITRAFSAKNTNVRTKSYERTNSTVGKPGDNSMGSSFENSGESVQYARYTPGERTSYDRPYSEENEMVNSLEMKHSCNGATVYDEVEVTKSGQSSHNNAPMLQTNMLAADGRITFAEWKVITKQSSSSNTEAPFHYGSLENSSPSTSSRRNSDPGSLQKSPGSDDTVDSCVYKPSSVSLRVDQASREEYRQSQDSFRMSKGVDLGAEPSKAWQASGYGKGAHPSLDFML